MSIDITHKHIEHGNDTILNPSIYVRESHPPHDRARLSIKNSQAARSGLAPGPEEGLPGRKSLQVVHILCAQERRPRPGQSGLLLEA